MRALLRDREDNTLIAIEVTEVYYDPDEQTVYLTCESDDTYYIEKVVRVNADSIARELVDKGTADLTEYLACRDD